MKRKEFCFLIRDFHGWEGKAFCIGKTEQEAKSDFLRLYGSAYQVVRTISESAPFLP